jgi:hypothetical protein
MSSHIISITYFFMYLWEKRPSLKFFPSLNLPFAIGKRLRLSPAFPLLRTERASFQAFRGPSSDGFVNYKFQVTLVDLGYLICINSHFSRYLLIFCIIGSVIPKFPMSVFILTVSVIWISLCKSLCRMRRL